MTAPPTADILKHTLLAMAVIVACARLLGVAFRKLHQPAVIGEVVAGIALGPSLLGRVAPELSHAILPPEIAPGLSLLAQVGILLYMFLVGLELDTEALARHGRATIVIAQSGIVVPFLLGIAVAVGLYPAFTTEHVTFTVFALFLGVSMSVTAFPVLARILTDQGIQRSRLGMLALACAAVGDMTAWCLLAFVVSVARNQVGSAVATVALTAVYLGFMLFVARPLIRRWIDRFGIRRAPGREGMAVVCVGLLLSALCTESIGIHAIFGAFLLGAIIPHESELAHDLTRRLEDFVVVLLLPAYFAFTGMRTQVGLVSGASQWMLCGLLVLVASVGKFGGCAIAGRSLGMSWRDSASIGTLMNTRGLMELVVLNIGFDLGVISAPLFAMLVLMAIITTLMTTPVLHLITRGDTSLASVRDFEVSK